jgi:hypothetical protein
VSLTQTKIKELESKGFDKLYTEHKALWDRLAANARKYAKDHITGGAEPRLDDILKMLLPMNLSMNFATIRTRSKPEQNVTKHSLPSTSSTRI